ncbi:hypothetical protein [Trinickia soli]|uniref:Uncharacterized protein n=1 Tax=Trinickia soli TaxID=380675 RepID=A0A2N7WFV2_9BURK|nr:hypothetical protein [Trinickia soli]KAA0089768.1 hypothetical protein CIW54_07145 [Paraburkholderia sp. T12-10]PMS28234.1 hypothetical protein C0Z19_00405 [Trinickia soli]CAB3662923.1 hypothetical protein LMG24076_01542 [Trinickia soli]
MIYFTTQIGPEWTKVLLGQQIEAQVDGWIAEEADRLSDAQQAQARRALDDFHAGLSRQWITIQSTDDKVAGVFRYMLSFLVEFTEPGRNGDEHREALIRDAYGPGAVDQNVLAKLREEGERLHPALHGLAHVIEQVAPGQ